MQDWAHRTGAERARVLVVDGDAGTAATVGAVLEHDGYAVDVAASHADALSLVQHARFDVILTDLRVEDMLGTAVIERARATSPAPTIVVLAGYASLESALRALRDGAYSYIMKPVDVDELRITIARALERRSLEGELAERVRQLEAAHESAQDFNIRLRAQVDAATAELRRKVEELDEANRQLTQTQEQHERFVAMVAHEMRGPLNPIINYAQLAKRPELEQASIDRYMDIVVEHAFRLNRLVDDLQTATRLSTGQFSLRIAPCDIAEAAAEVVDQLSATVRERVFRLERPEGPLVAEADRDRVVQAMRNLIDNAVKYSAEGGAIEVAVAGDDDSVHIHVGDYGAGIPEADMQRIFEAFIRLGDRDQDVGGSGLGLFITRGIVAAHHGTLHVANRGSGERAQGAIFTISLPRTQGVPGSTTR